MSGSFTSFALFCVIVNSLLNCALCVPYLSNDKHIESILNDIFRGNIKSNSDPHGYVRRQLDFGQENPKNRKGRYSRSDEVTEPSHQSFSEIPPESWTGRWFPGPDTERPPSIGNHADSPDPNSMWKMINSSCDDGKTNLTVDWSGSPINYTCVNPHHFFSPNYDLPNLLISSLIPPHYHAQHECMSKEIHYDSDIPTFGTHRPAWPHYGEYKFVPRQRWLHNLEHGAIVMLYHPCAHPELVNELRNIVNKCLYRHIITPYTLLPPDRPLALLSWGWAFLMSFPDNTEATSFIRSHALRGPEALSKNGQFSEGLIKPASLVTDIDDSTICPQILF